LGIKTPVPTKIDPTLRPFHAKVYEAIRECWLDYGVSPSQVELSHAVMCSTTTVIQAIRELKKRGYITAQKSRARSLRPVDVDLQVIIRAPDPWGDLSPPKKFWKRV
jgi:DNA-binding transcriptional MocR family regulator